MNTDGRAEYFGVHNIHYPAPSAIDHEWSLPHSGRGQDSLGGATHQIFEPGCAQNARGQMHVFIVGTDQKIWTRWQNKPNSVTSYAPWNGSLGGPPKGVILLGNVAAVYASTQKIELFTISCDTTLVCQMYTKFQTVPNSGWSGWVALGGNFLNRAVSADRFGNGGAIVRARGMDDRTWCNKRSTAGGGWSGWTKSDC